MSFQIFSEVNVSSGIHFVRRKSLGTLYFHRHLVTLFCTFLYTHQCTYMYIHCIHTVYIRFVQCIFYTLSSHTIQLGYRESLQDGAAVRVLFPDTEGGHIDLAIGRCVEAAVKLLRPIQENQNIDGHYRQQAWSILQVRHLLHVLNQVLYVHVLVYIFCIFV